MSSLSAGKPSRLKNCVAACTIGDEVLGGKTQDGNSHYLSKQLFRHGVPLHHIQVVPDEEEEIIQSVQYLSNTYGHVFTSGGIGPTHDDITYSSIAKAFHLDLKPHQETLDRMKAIGFSPLSSSPRPPPTPEMIKSRERMALLPHPAKVTYPCPQYWIPLVTVNDNVHILPGIPSLYAQLVDAALPSLLASLSSSPLIRLSIGTNHPESEISQILAQVQQELDQQDHEDRRIRIGSYPRWPMTSSPRVVVTLVGKDKGLLDHWRKWISSKIDGFDV